MRRILIYLACFVLLTSFVNANELFAKDFQLSYKTIEDNAPLGDEAEFEFQVENKLNTAKRFRLKNTATEFDIRTSPISVKLSGQKIFAQSKGEPFKVFLTPIENTRLGQHEVVLELKFEGGAVSKLNLPIYVEPQSAAKDRYKTSILVDTSLNPELDPRNEFVMNINLDNLNRKPLDNIIVTAKGNLFDEKMSTSLQPLEKGKIVKVKKQFDPRLKPQQDEILITVTADNETIKTFTKIINIIDYTGELLEKTHINNKFLVKKFDYTFTNDGNSVKSQVIKKPINGFSNFFTSTEPKANIITTAEGDKFLAWDLSLNPGETTSLYVKTSYQLPAVIIVLFMLGFLIYYWTKSPVVVTKRAVNIGNAKGDISDIKINIHVRNPSMRSIENVHIVDHVPSIAYVLNEFKVGTLQPTKILKHEKRGDNLIKWELDALDPHEDRILTYRIKTKLSIIGNISLPAAKVKYKKGKKTKIVKSNTLQIEA